MHALPLPPRFVPFLSTAPDAAASSSRGQAMRAQLLPVILSSDRAHANLLKRLGAEAAQPLERTRRRSHRRPTITPATGAHPFFSKQLVVRGIPVKAHARCTDAALFIAAERIGRMLRNLPPDVPARLRRRGAAIHIVGSRQQVSNLPEHAHLRGRRGDYADEARNDPRRTERHGVWAERSDNARGYRYPLLSADQLTVDERTRGLGGLICSCGEENLVEHDTDPRYAGRDVLTHEFAHTLMDYGLPRTTRAAIVEAFERSTITRGLWRRPCGSKAYAATCAEEYFAELSMWFWGSHGEFVCSTQKLPRPGPHGLAEYDAHGFGLVGSVYGGSHPSFSVNATETEPVVLRPIFINPVCEASQLLSTIAECDRHDDGEVGVQEMACTLEIDNQAGSHTIQLSWITPDGTPKSYGEVAAGTRSTRFTYSGHTWMVEGDSMRACYVASRDALQVIKFAEDLRRATPSPSSLIPQPHPEVPQHQPQPAQNLSSGSVGAARGA